MTDHVWTIAEAKARLSEVLRRASDEGPQRIGTQRRYVVVPEETWNELTVNRQPLGAWLVEQMPRGEPLELPDRADPSRRPLFDEPAT
jgi:prevent-host-death family protein